MNMISIFPIRPRSSSVLSKKKRVHKEKTVMATGTKPLISIMRGSSSYSAQRNIGSSLPSIDQLTIQNAELSHLNPENSIDTARGRRVRFIDEISGLSSRNLVTSTAFRPITRAQDRIMLYYTSLDYADFAFEEFVRKMEKEPVRVRRRSWDERIADVFSSNLFQKVLRREMKENVQSS